MKISPFLILLLTLASLARAADWPQWRGPTFNGSTDETNLPSSWSQTENVAWSADLAGAAASTPIISGDRVFLSGIDAAKETVQAICFDRADGKLLWKHDIAQGIHRDQRSNFAAPSPVADGRVVFFFFSTGDLICFDFDGTRRWARNIQTDYGTFAFLWTFSSSPVLFDGKLYMQVLQRDVPVAGRGLADRFNESYLLAMDPATGKTLWRHVRPSKAVLESREAFSTPTPFIYKGAKQLLVIGGDALTAHDAATGRELWRWGTWNPGRIPHWRLVPSPVAGDGVVLACAPKRDPIYAVTNGGSGLLDDTALAWVSRDEREISSDVPTPAFYDGDFFVLSDVRKCLSRVEPRTGKVKWTMQTPGRVKYEASPLAADGKVYIVNFDGDVSLINAADGKLLGTIAMDAPEGTDKVRASISAAGGQLFIRATKKLYCVGPSSAAEFQPDEKVTYKTVGDVTLQLHVFKPAGHKASDARPCIVFFFGGGWNGGSPSQFYPHCRYLADRGMVAMAAEYRVKSRHGTTPLECVKDGKSAVRWIRQNADRLGIDPDRVAAGGGSAGGHVAAATGCTKGFEEPGEDKNVSSRPNALVLFNPVYDNGPTGYGQDRVKEHWREFSPMHNIDKHSPPTIVFLGTKDKLIPVATAEKYKALMTAAGGRCELFLYEDQPHGFFNYRGGKSKYYHLTVIEADKFLASLGYLKGKPTLELPAHFGTSSLSRPR